MVFHVPPIYCCHKFPRKRSNPFGNDQIIINQQLFATSLMLYSCISSKTCLGGTVGIPLGVLVYWPQKIKYIQTLPGTSLVLLKAWVNWLKMLKPHRGNCERPGCQGAFWRQYVVFWQGPNLYFINKTMALTDFKGTSPPSLQTFRFSNRHRPPSFHT